jgi:hypothetical protein
MSREMLGVLRPDQYHLVRSLPHAVPVNEPTLSYHPARSVHVRDIAVYLRDRRLYTKGMVGYVMSLWRDRGIAGTGGLQRAARKAAQWARSHLLLWIVAATAIDAALVAWSPS